MALCRFPEVMNRPEFWEDPVLLGAPVVAPWMKSRFSDPKQLGRFHTLVDCVGRYHQLKETPVIQEPFADFFLHTFGDSASCYQCKQSFAVGAEVVLCCVAVTVALDKSICCHNNDPDSRVLARFTLSRLCALHIPCFKRYCPDKPVPHPSKPFPKVTDSRLREAYHKVQEEAEQCKLAIAMEQEEWDENTVRVTVGKGFMPAAQTGERCTVSGCLALPEERCCGLALCAVHARPHMRKYHRQAESPLSPSALQKVSEKGEP